MSKEIQEWSVVPASNSLFAPVDGGWPEGMNRQDVNNAAREDLAALRRWYNDSQWIKARIQGPTAGDVGVFSRTGANTCTITLAGVDLSSYFTAGRVVKVINGGGAGVDLTTQCSINSTYLSGVTTITTKAAINVAATDIYTHSNSVIRAQALLEDNTQFFIPATADSAGIQAAVNAANAAGGGVVFLNQDLYTITTQLALTGNIFILGRHPRVRLLRAIPGGGSIAQYSDAAGHLSVENVVFDVDWLTTPVGFGAGILLSAAAATTIRTCEFIRAETGILMNGSTISRITIDDCYFTFHRSGIAAGSNFDEHSGSITNCTFDGSLQSLPAPASMKLSGAWSVVGNALINCYHASLVPTGIYIWDRTVAALGGLRSSVIGNIINGSGATGVAIWMGTSDGACLGNTISGSSATTGIKIGSSTASAFAERVVCHGNTITAGSLGIQVTEFARHGNITGNSIRPNTGTGLSLAGDLMVVMGNVFRNCPTGIDVLASGAQNSILENVIMDVSTDGVVVRALASNNVVSRNSFTGSPTRAINVEATALETLVSDNYAPNISIPVVNSATSSRITRNEQFRNPDVVIVNNQTHTETETAIYQAPLPGGGGIGEYCVSMHMSDDAGFGNECTMRLRVGPLGTISDPVVATRVYTFADSALDVTYPDEWIQKAEFRFSITTALDTKMTLTVENDTASSSGTVDFVFKIFKMTEPLG